jgi:hypothetical protein
MRKTMPPLGTVVRIKSGLRKGYRGVIVPIHDELADYESNRRVLLSSGPFECCPWELSVCRDQTPPPGDDQPQALQRRIDERDHERRPRRFWPSANIQRLASRMA